MSVDRSIRREVANPLLALPGVRQLQLLPPDARALVTGALQEIRMDARERANKAWFSHKAPMAAYWKAVSVYAGHLARILK